jgi:type IV pilus biogenesis protein PilP
MCVDLEIISRAIIRWAILGLILSFPAFAQANPASPQTLQESGDAKPLVPSPTPSMSLPAGPGVDRDDASEAPVLRELSQRQTELAILEMDLKRAELQKKLRDLQSPQVVVVPSAGAATPSGPTSLSSPSEPVPTISQPVWGKRSGPQNGPIVQRIHKVQGGLRALIRLPSGEVRDVALGATVGPSLRIIAISSDGVSARQGREPPFVLPVTGGEQEVF